MKTRQVVGSIRFLYKKAREAEPDVDLTAVFGGISAGEALLRAGDEHLLVELLRLEHDQLSLLTRTRDLIRGELANRPRLR